jgi:hypothetical protein
VSEGFRDLDEFLLLEQREGTKIWERHRATRIRLRVA